MVKPLPTVVVLSVWQCDTCISKLDRVIMLHNYPELIRLLPLWKHLIHATEVNSVMGHM